MVEENKHSHGMQEMDGEAGKAMQTPEPHLKHWGGWTEGETCGWNCGLWQTQKQSSQRTIEE